MQTPSKNSISSFSVQVEYTNQTLILSLHTRARPGQATDPDNVVFHTSRSYQGRWVRNRRAVVCLCTGCHPEEASLAVAAALEDLTFSAREETPIMVAESCAVRKALTQYRLCFFLPENDRSTIFTEHSFPYNFSCINILKASFKIMIR